MIAHRPQQARRKKFYVSALHGLIIPLSFFSRLPFQQYKLHDPRVEVQPGARRKPDPEKSGPGPFQATFGSIPRDLPAGTRR
jgi:hypothetical protein